MWTKPWLAAAGDDQPRGDVEASLKRDSALMYALFFSPRESSMSRRIASNSHPSASRSASFR
jgi:hypothetical protein